MKKRYFIELAFKGTQYHGWQIQPNAITVQQIINNSLSTLLEEDIKTIGAGRTDTGVHARYFVAHFDCNNELTNNTSFLYQINSIIPADIVINSITKVNDDAHSRFDALSRTYKYYISRKKDPFSIETSYNFNQPLNTKSIHRATRIIKNNKDFSCFSKSHTSVKTNNCSIIKAKWDYNDDIYTFTIEADRFLRNMVRAIVGTLIEVGREKINLQNLRSIIESKNRSEAGYTVPAQGLFLEDIKYTKEIFNPL